MTDAEREILKTLTDLEAAVKSVAKTQLRPSLLPFFARLDELAGQLPPDTSPELLHYLRKKSYEKARLWLEGRDPEIARGGCRGD